MKKAFIASFVFLALLFSTPYFAFADVGVTVNTAKIALDKAIVPGATYDIPSIQVKNSGTEGSDYGVTVDYNQTQTEMKPDIGWFTMTPSTFHLEPGESKIVKLSIALPTSAAAGDYFSYIEAHSMKKDGSTDTSIAGAAAAKFYFSVAKSNIFEKSYYSTVSFVHQNSSWSYIVLGLLAIGIIYLFVRRLRAMITHIGSKNLS